MDPVRIPDAVVGPAPAAPVGERRRPATPAEGPSFQGVLKQVQERATSTVRFSAHAQTRLQSRRIALGPGELNRIEGAVDRAASKGVRESLVLLDQTAFVVSVSNRTVITVVDRENLKHNVFTNIDGAVIA